MSIYKELQYSLTYLADKQVRIYNDSADAGIAVRDANDPTCVLVKEILNSPDLVGGLKQHRKEIRTASSVVVTIKLYIPWEESSPNHCRCSKWEISYVSDLIRRKKYIQFIAAPDNVGVSEIFIKP